MPDIATKHQQVAVVCTTVPTTEGPNVDPIPEYDVVTGPVSSQILGLTAAVTGIASELRRLRQVFENQTHRTPFLNEEAAAGFLSIDVGSIEYYAKRRRRLPYHVVGRKLLFHRDDLVKFAQRCRRPGVDG